MIARFPLLLRLFLWIAKCLLRSPSQVQLRETLQFVLDHPRRVYTYLFPAAHSWYLLLTMGVLSGFDWGGFEFLNTSNPNLSAIPVRTRLLNGLFQAVSIRSAGFNIISIAQLSIGNQALCLVMMYISVYPVVITMRSSNVYEERSLGIYAEDMAKRTGDGEVHGEGYLTRMYFLRQQLRAQLSHDLWWIVVAVFIITCIEGGNFLAQPLTYSVFNIIFEVVSAYGPVGLSMGLPDQNYSLSGGWHRMSKLVLCTVMLRGRHRGLPVKIDRAISLPGERLAEVEQKEREVAAERLLLR
jgi:Trk-type K+ transport system membrane component